MPIYSGLFPLLCVTANWKYTQHHNGGTLHYLSVIESCNLIIVISASQIKPQLATSCPVSDLKASSHEKCLIDFCKFPATVLEFCRQNTNSSQLLCNTRHCNVSMPIVLHVHRFHTNAIGNLLETQIRKCKAYLKKLNIIYYFVLWVCLFITYIIIYKNM